MAPLTTSAVGNKSLMWAYHKIGTQDASLPSTPWGDDRSRAQGSASTHLRSVPCIPNIRRGKTNVGGAKQSKSISESSLNWLPMLLSRHSVLRRKSVHVEREFLRLAQQFLQAAFALKRTATLAQTRAHSALVHQRFFFAQVH